MLVLFIRVYLNNSCAICQQIVSTVHLSCKIHPDKNKSKELKSHHIEDSKRSFNELQEAWDNYENLAKMMRKATNGDEADANFTLFGVGCSFSDSPAERALRDEIMEQGELPLFVTLAAL